MIRKLPIFFAALLMLLFGGMTVRKLLEYRQSSQSFEQLAAVVVSETESASAREPERNPEQDNAEPTEAAYSEFAPISVDFEALLQKNPDCIGWLYSEDTPINYPVMLAKDNEKYLYDNFYGIRDFAGCLFLDCEGSSSFDLEKNFIFGHNMQNDSMFGSLDGYSWGGQNYYEKHRAMYLLTPLHNYRLDVLAGAYLSEDAELFDYGTTPGWLEEMVSNSTFRAWKDRSDTNCYTLLSTCSGRGHELRYVIVCGMKRIG